MLSTLDLRRSNISAGDVRLAEAKVTNEGSPYVLVTYTVRERLNGKAALFDQLRGRFLDSLPVNDLDRQHLEEQLASLLSE
jgi:hypothetical protein